MSRTIVFDVNETLLDLNALNPHFERIFGDVALKTAWFKQVLQTALVMTVLGEYTDFGSVGGIALDMTALRQGVTLSDDDRAAIRDTMLNLPPHPEVPEALTRLKNAGFRLAALTNSAQQAAETQLTNAGLAPLFEHKMSVEAVRRFKPAAEVYNMAAEALGEAPSNLRMVAAHDWDVAGAMHAGWRGAFVARPGMVIAPQAEHPDIIGSDMTEVVNKILVVDV
ncbi:MAG: haloacid dehalogenase type II [Chloroflexi bacterium]|nr:MAG: haloacid dehalogenase type II [Chloroflexota bacterium]